MGEATFRSQELFGGGKSLLLVEHPISREHPSEAGGTVDVKWWKGWEGICYNMSAFPSMTSVWRLRWVSELLR